MDKNTTLIVAGLVGLFLFTHYKVQRDEYGLRVVGDNPLAGNPPLPVGGTDYRYGPPPSPPGSVGERIRQIETGVKAVKSVFDDFKGLFK